jgi:PH domain
MSTNDRKRSTSGGEDDLIDAALIDGYLDKLGRNGKWQTRWFETDGECLTYYKSSKRMKLLATLDLAKVGSIVIDSSDPAGCCFMINISERPYHLRAESKAACRDWVITLNRVKEARMQQGNVKLVSSNQPPDLLDEHYTPRVVVVAKAARVHGTILCLKILRS